MRDTRNEFLLRMCLTLTDAAVRPADHAHVDIKVKGDVSSLHWVESQLKYFSEVKENVDKEMCLVYHAAVNERDVLYANGRLLHDELPST